MKFAVKKIITTIITLLLVSLIAFFVFNLIPGDAALSSLGTDATPELIAQRRMELGLDNPILIRYFNWLKGLLIMDLGISYKFNIKVTKLLGEKMFVSAILGLISFLMIIVLGITMGIAAYKFGNKNRVGIIDWFNQILMAVPSFVTGMLIIFIFGLVLKWFTPGGYVPYSQNKKEFFLYLIPAAFAIALPKIAMVVKFLKNELTNQMQSDYIRTARSKGASENRIIFKHALKNSLMPVVTLLGMIVAEILAGSLIIEQVFNIPGLGRALISGIGTRDYPVISAIIMYTAALVIIMNLIVDLLYKVLNVSKN